MTHAFDSGSTAVLLMGYGGPDCLDAVGPFMCELTGREPGPEMLERIQARYSAIGGKSPLPEIAEEFARVLESRLAEDGTTVPVRVGFRYTPPEIGRVLSELYDDGVRRVVAVSLSPFESKSTDVAYACAVDDARPACEGLQVAYAPAFSGMPIFAELHQRGLVSALESLDTPASETLIVFTAHSLPVADLETPERYVSGLRSVAAVIAAAIGLDAGSDFTASTRLPGIEAWGAPDAERPWLLAYQSKGFRPGEWLGPELEDVMQLAASQGFKAVAVSPIGFATEHMETRYDLDIVEADRARELGLRFARGAAPNSEPDLVAAVSSAVRELLAHGE